MIESKYRENILAIMDRQQEKGVKKYGSLLEDNDLGNVERIEYLQEELVDALQYCEHIKDRFRTIEAAGDSATSPNKYQKEALRTARAGVSQRGMILEAALGISGEAGEVVDLVKKFAFQGHKLHAGKIVEELGDLLWYIALMTDALGETLECVMNRNIQKLKARYPEGFSEERSINRDEAGKVLSDFLGKGWVSAEERLPAISGVYDVFTASKHFDRMCFSKKYSLFNVKDIHNEDFARTVAIKCLFWREKEEARKEEECKSKTSES